jgi:long-chain acyl-CoA synthetase
LHLRWPSPGVQKYGKVAIISNNRWEWATIAAAAYSLSAILVPMYEAQLETDWTYILNDSSSSVVVCANQDIFDRIRKDVLPATPSVQACICLDGEEEYSFPTLMAAASKSTSQVVAPTPEDLADLIYTSGTTGKPKGVELTHANLTSNVKASRCMSDDPRELVRETDVSLAFLPWAHSYGQTCELWMSMSMGSGMAVCRGVPLLLEDLQLVKPTVLFSVPTLYKKIFDGVNNLMENASPLRKSLMKSALDLGARNAEHRNGNGGPLGLVDRVKFSALDRIILSKIRARFGGNMTHGYVAGAACAPETLQFMDSLGIPICEGYGLTETSPIIAINVPSRRSVGSVGQPIGGVEVCVIDEEGNPLPPGAEGEICCVGPNVMKGYHNNQEATDEVISFAPDGVSRMYVFNNGWHVVHYFL